MPPRRRIATYRLQINKDFTLDDAAAVAPYLHKLGISHIYLSPILESTPGSTHGYDITDFSKISDERGGADAFKRLNDVAASLNPPLNILLDIVPNHMGIAGENPYWFDVLAKGRNSPYWDLFDIRIGDGEKIQLATLAKELAEIDEKELKLVETERFGICISVSGRNYPLRDETQNDLRAQAEDSGQDFTQFATSLDKDVILDLLSRQPYELVLWTEAFEKISYRRFFNITELIGVKVEREDIYQLSHDFLFHLLHQHKLIDGVRVDHIDGLALPTNYLQRLHQNVGSILVEKILAPDEDLPVDWPVQGTTGYEFVSRLNGVFVDPARFSVLQKYWVERLEPRWQDFQSCVRESKEEILGKLFPSEMNRLVALSKHRGDERSARLFFTALTVCLKVYRTYGGEKSLSAADRAYLDEAVEAATEIYGTEFAAAAKKFLPILTDPQTEQERQVIIEWQQLSGPAMAKGLEDTAHYRYNPLAALNEVGCDGDVHQAEDIIGWFQEIAKTHPDTLLATSTHDTKRSEDARHRLYALADRAEDWIDFFEKAREIAAPFIKDFTLRPGYEWLLYQSMIATWPVDDEIDDHYVERLQAFAEKSSREARLDTDWLKPNEPFEKGIANFIAAVLGDATFKEHFDGFAKEIAADGAIISLSALTMKILGPAVPDIYQGQENWDFSLVDPDNRRPVAFDAHQQLIDRLRGYDGGQENAKIWLTHKLLELRKTYLSSGPVTIEPVALSGEDADKLVAFSAGCEGEARLTVICPRYPARLGDGFSVSAHARLAAGSYRNLLHDEAVPGPGADIGALFSRFPIAVICGT